MNNTNRRGRFHRRCERSTQLAYCSRPWRGRRQPIHQASVIPKQGQQGEDRAAHAAQFPSRRTRSAVNDGIRGGL